MQVSQFFALGLCETGEQVCELSQLLSVRMYERTDLRAEPAMLRDVSGAAWQVHCPVRLPVC